MVINSLPQFCGKSYTGFRCKKLGSDTDCKYDTHINDLGNYYRNKQIEHNFQKFEERCKNAFFLIVF